MSPLSPSLHPCKYLTMPKTRSTTTSSSKSSKIVTNSKRKRGQNPKPSENAQVADIEDLLNFNEQEIGEIRVSMLDWYDKNKRDLPWRRLDDDDDDVDRKGYGVWVSEVMLQQTQVATVVDYYNRWMEKWPTLHLLSLASVEEVNEMWAGLGYYRRARFLLEGAKKIIEEGGQFPRTVSSLKKVPGIGDYTAGAIASIAFNESVPLVDGNVVRVLARLRTISANPKDSVIVKKFWRLAGQLVDLCRPGDFNQALMELGATVCTPTSPGCSKCPVSTQCQAFSQSQQGGPIVTDYPPKVIKAKQRNEIAAVCVLEIIENQNSVEDAHNSNQYLLVKRPEKGLLAGLWEFPSVLLEKEASMAIRRKTIDKFLKQSFNLNVNENYEVILRDDVGEYVHVFSHIRLKMFVEVLVIQLKGGLNLLQSEPDEGSMVWKCVGRKELSSMGLTSGVRKVYTMVEKFKENSQTNSICTLKATKSRKGR
ncbi:adenine DNA glycosylase [Silene latifolia]|uniref:adenine DNA glycosylase n=1 Tax=Silene latifolia TaxID=37657 RepID=UPI003D783AFA